MDNEQIDFKLTQKQGKIIKVLMELLAGLIILYLVVSASYQYGGIKACENSGEFLILSPEFRCYNEQELQNRGFRFLNESFNSTIDLNDLRG